MQYSQYSTVYDKVNIYFFVVSTVDASCKKHKKGKKEVEREKTEENGKKHERVCVWKKKRKQELKGPKILINSLHCRNE